MGTDRSDLQQRFTLMQQAQQRARAGSSVPNTPEEPDELTPSKPMRDPARLRDSSYWRDPATEASEDAFHRMFAV